MNRITCRDLCISYNGYLAVDHVSFSLNAQKMFLHSRRKRFGKSTLGQRVVGAGQARAGTVAVSGIKRTEIGYLPQQTVVQKDFPRHGF